MPSEIVYRDPEVDHLPNVLQALVDSESVDTAFITGPTGSGKTCIAKFTVDRLRQIHLVVESI